MAQRDFSQKAEDFRRIEKAIRYLESNFRNQPSLDDIAASVHLSKYHFQRLFKRWAGISPTQFLHFLTLDYTKRKLAESRSLLDTALDSGLSGPGRLHDLFVTFEAMTPGEYKKMGAGLRVAYGFHPTPFGECLLAVTGKGICHLGFIEDNGRDQAFSVLQNCWPQATFRENPKSTQVIAADIFSVDSRNPTRPFHLLLKGTNFQVQVWRALVALPRGKVFSYQDLAAFIGRPKSVRAVANAIAANPIGYLIPCHRVITNSGVIHRYRWGTARKKAILGWEALADN